MQHLPFHLIQGDVLQGVFVQQKNPCGMGQIGWRSGLVFASTVLKVDCVTDQGMHLAVETGGQEKFLCGNNFVMRLFRRDSRLGVAAFDEPPVNRESERDLIWA